MDQLAWLAPIFLKKVISNVEKKYREQQQNQNNATPDGKVGETVIEKKPSVNNEGNKKIISLYQSTIIINGVIS